MMGSAYFTTQYLQSVLGNSAMEAALWALLPSVLIGAAAPVATALVQRGMNRAHVVATGFVLSAAGFGLLAFTGTDSLWLVLAGAGVLACGAVIIGSQLTDLALGAAPAEKAGTASSLLETGQEFGGAMGMALLGSIGNAVYQSRIPDAAPAEAQETLGGAVAVAQQLPAHAADALLTASRDRLHRRHARGGADGHGGPARGGGPGVGDAAEGAGPGGEPRGGGSGRNARCRARTGVRDPHTRAPDGLDTQPARRSRVQPARRVRLQAARRVVIKPVRRLRTNSAKPVTDPAQGSGALVREVHRASGLRADLLGQLVQDRLRHRVVDGQDGQRLARPRRRGRPACRRC